MKKKKSLIIGLVGLPGAGKTTVAKQLASKGFVHVTLSYFIKEEAKKDGISDFSREVLQNYGNKMREAYGPQILAQLALKKIREERPQKVVIDGVRNLYEVAFLKVENNFVLIGITARPKLRYQRLTERTDRPWRGTYAEFLKQEQREDSLGSREIGLRVKECFKQAHFEIDNNKTLEHLRTATDVALKNVLR